MIWLEKEAKMLPEYERLVKKIRSERKRLGLSQRELAAKADISKSVVGKLERKENVPNYKNVKAIHKVIEKEREDEKRRAREYMNEKIISVKPADKLKDAAEIMNEHGFSQLPVREKGDYVGLIVSTQLIDVKDKEKKVSELDYRPLPSIPPRTPREDFSRLFDSNRAVLVKSENNVLGIITAADLI